MIQAKVYCEVCCTGHYGNCPKIQSAISYTNNVGQPIVTPPKQAMKDTTTTIDTDLEQLFLNDIFYVGDDLPQTSDGKNKFVLLGTPYDFMLAIMDWHKDKARSYTLDLYYIVPDELDEIVSRCEGKHVQQVVYSTYHKGFTRICFGCMQVDTTLKAIEESK